MTLAGIKFCDHSIGWLVDYKAWSEKMEKERKSDFQTPFGASYENIC